jgi:hypothetical protein
MTIHRTAMGKSVDMSALAGQHEKTRAVSNLNMNARGDIVDSHNRIIQDNTQRVRASYAATVNPATGQVPSHLTPPTRSDAHIVADTHPITEELQAPVIQPEPIVMDEPVELTPEEQELFSDDTEDEEDIK